MSSKAEQKKILKLLKSKHVIERLDGLYDLKDLGEQALFAFNQLKTLVEKDVDDLVRINALDLLYQLSEFNLEAKSMIEICLNDKSMGVRRKAEKLLQKAEKEQEEEQEEDRPLTDELFEKIEEQIVVTEEPIVVPKKDDPEDFVFDLEEFSIGEVTELTPGDTIPISTAAISGTTPIPHLKTPTPSKQATISQPSSPKQEPTEVKKEEEKQEEELEEVEEKEIELLPMDEKPIENSWKNLMIVFEKLSTVENKDLRQKIFSHVSTILELLVEFLQKEMEIGTEEDLKTFMEYEFKEEEEEFLRNIVCLITDKIKEGFEELRQVPALAFMGNLAQKLGFIEETLEIYEAVIKTDGENIQVLHNLAMFYAKIGKDDQAIKLFEKILELEPENKKALAKLGDLYFYKKQDYETAEKFYKETFENDPSQYSIGINLAAVLGKRKKFAEATNILHSCLKENPEVPDLWLNYAILLVKQLKFHEALEAYTKTLELAPEDWVFKERTLKEKEKVETFLASEEYSEAKEEEVQYLVDKKSKVKIQTVFIFAKEPLEDEVFLAIFDYFKTKKHKYSIPEDLEPYYGSIYNKEDFPIDPLRAKEFGESIWAEQLEKELDLSKLYIEMFDLEEYDKVVIFLEEE